MEHPEAEDQTRPQVAKQLKILYSARINTDMSEKLVPKTLENHACQHITA